ncbi:XRE family transcriptional regulator protein (plasmid) [Rhizobium phaseoli]|nr:XRE family transcriptional regulator protein [Rhizobium phaseoli]KKZ84227.1 putative transcriptional regulator [Rhizobium phaseoli Ch24-10]
MLPEGWHGNMVPPAEICRHDAQSIFLGFILIAGDCSDHRQCAGPEFRRKTKYLLDKAASVRGGEISDTLNRSAQKLTQEVLAVDSRVDRTVISDLERGKYNVSIDLLDRLADAPSIDISQSLSVPLPGDRPKPMKAGRKPKI